MLYECRGLQQRHIWVTASPGATEVCPASARAGPLGHATESGRPTGRSSHVRYTDVPNSSELTLAAKVVLLEADLVISMQDGFPYIDSWNLTGFCANHAILTVNFSNIVQHIKDARVSKEDRESIRLWGAICLNHLQ